MSSSVYQCLSFIQCEIIFFVFEEDGNNLNEISLPIVYNFTTKFPQVSFQIIVTFRIVFFAIKEWKSELSSRKLDRWITEIEKYLEKNQTSIYRINALALLFLGLNREEIISFLDIQRSRLQRIEVFFSFYFFQICRDLKS